MRVFADKNNQLRISGNNKLIKDLTFKELKTNFPHIRGKTKTMFLNLVEIEAYNGIKKGKIKTLVKAVIFIIIIAIAAALSVSYVLR